MKTFNQYITEARKYDSLESVVAAIKQYKKAGEIVNPEYQDLLYDAKKAMEKEAELGKGLLRNFMFAMREKGEENDELWDLTYDWPSDSFVSLKKFKRTLDKFAKIKFSDNTTRDSIVKIGNYIFDNWSPVADDLKELKGKVVKVTQVRARKKEKEQKVLEKKKADSKVLVKELETQRKEYVDMATKRAKEFVKQKLDALKKKNMDLKQLLPQNTRTGGASQLRAIYSMITTSAYKGSRSMKDPDIRKRSAAGVKRFIDQKVREAEDNFDAFVNKMVTKVGPITKANLTGTIWTNATLTVTTVEGNEEKWSTKVIINFSKYGKMFNQFPTRKLKR